MLSNLVLCAAGFATAAIAHADHQKPIAGPHKSLWYNALPGDGGTQVFWLILSSPASRPLVGCRTFHA